MHYMFLIYGNESDIAAAGAAETEESIAKNMALLASASGKGVLVGTGALLPTANSTTVRRTSEGILTTDGPFAETKEQLGGFYILDCRDLDEAISWASQMPACGGGCIEIRPMMQMPE